MEVNLTLSVEEATMLSTCLDFVENNLVLNEKTCAWHFVPGMKFDLSIRSAGLLYLLNSYIKESRQEAIDTHPFVPFFHWL